jgi:meso-butanediol dehydrogenase/(S,S)-butanediol dehydrogenase/diacetyl reductase
MSGQRVADQVALVTGGTSGIGAATVSLFLAEGAKVFITDLEERDITSRLSSKNVIFHQSDVSSPDQCEAAVNACVKAYGKIDILFSNAGMFCPPGHVPDADVLMFQKTLMTNVGGLFYLSKAAIPYMRKQGKGAIIATASTTGLGGAMSNSSYAASKAAVINLCKSMALDHGKEGIRVNAVAPGMTNTPMTAPFAQMPALKEDILGRTPMRRFGEPEEVAKAVLFLASDDAAYITGQGELVAQDVLHVNDTCIRC